MDKRRSFLAHFWMQLLILLAILLVGNHLSSQWFLRVDLTHDQRFTLSSVTQNTVRNLKRPLQARVYYTEDLQAPYNNLRQALLDKLNELRAASNGMMSIEIVDSSTGKAFEEEANEFGIEAIPYRYKKGTLTEARTVYMGAVLLYGDLQAPLGPFVAEETMEYEIVRSIRLITGEQDQIKTLGYLISEGEPDLAKVDPNSPLGQFKTEVNKDHNLIPITLGGLDNPLNNVDALFVMGPQLPMHPRAQYQLDQYLMTGKPASFFVGSFRPDFGAMRSMPVRHGLNSLLGHYGIQLNKDAVVDRKHNHRYNVPVTKGARTRNVPVNYPLIPKTTNLNRNHLLGRGKHEVMIPFASSLTLDTDPRPGTRIETLISTMDGSGSIQSLRHIHPSVFKVPAPGEEAGPHVVGATITGRLSSFFLNKEVPIPAGVAPDDPRFSSDPTQTIADGAPTRILVVSSADFMANNSGFLLDSVDWMLDDPELMGIRSKLEPPPPMTRPEGAQALAYKLGIFGVPSSVLILFGLLAWLRGRRT